MKHTDGKVTFIDIKDDNAILETETGLKIEVPLGFMIGLGDAGNHSRTYREFIVKHLQKNNVYIPPEFI